MLKNTLTMHGPMKVKCVKRFSNVSYFSEKRDLTLFRRRLRKIRKKMDIRRNNKNKNHNMVLGDQ
jgi:hypothetical protein